MKKLMTFLVVSFIFCVANAEEKFAILKREIGQKIIITYLSTSLDSEWKLDWDNEPPKKIHEIRDEVKKFLDKNFGDGKRFSLERISLKRHLYREKEYWYWSVMIREDSVKSRRDLSKKPLAIFLPVSLEGKILASFNSATPSPKGDGLKPVD